MVVTRQLLILVCLAGCLDSGRYPESNRNGTCGNGRVDGSETDVDCGGGVCPACVEGKACAGPGDCETLECGARVCMAAQCSDGKKGGLESDIDCGGLCPPCGVAQQCGSALDCGFGTCTAGRCAYVEQDLVAPLLTQPLGRSVAMANQMIAAGATWVTGQTATASQVVLYTQTTDVVWGRKAKLEFADTTHRSGAAVALGTTSLFVGSPGNPATSGRVDVWSNALALTDNAAVTSQFSAPDAIAGDDFGAALAVAALGGDDFIVVGAPLRVVNTVQRGEAYVFSRSTTAWQQVATLWSGTPTPAHFGTSVASSQDLWAVVGAPGDADHPGFVRLVFGLTGPGHTVTAPTPSNGDLFGSSVAAFGATAAVGARGAAYTVDRSNPGVSAPQALPLSDFAKTSGVPLTVAMSEQWLAVGVPAGLGRVETFQRQGAVWLRGPVIQSATTGDGFGSVIALWSQQLAVGMPLQTPLGQVSVFGRY